MRVADQRRTGAKRVVPLLLLLLVPLSCSVLPVRDPAGAAGCGAYESWRTSVGMGDPRGRGLTPRGAVAALVDESVTVGEVVSQTRWKAEVAVSHERVSGVYQLWRVGRTWRVYGGDGCPASAGAPIIPEGYHCSGPDPETLVEGQAYTQFCGEGQFHSPSDGWYEFP